MTTVHPVPEPKRLHRPPLVVLSSVSSDSHTWNLVYLELLLGELGFQVRNLGPCVPDRLLLDACREQRPDLVVLSSVNGHGAHDAERAVRRLRADAVLGALPAVVGGKLGTRGPADEQERAQALTGAGFDGVFEGPDALTRFLAYLAPILDATAARRAATG